MQIEFIVLAMHDRVVDDGIRAVDPPSHIRILFQQTLKIDLDRCSLEFFPALFSGVILFGHILLRSLFILNTSLPVL